MLVFKGEKIHRRICSYRYIYLVKILVFPVRSGGGGRQILSRSLLGEEKRSDTVVAGHRLLRGHGNLSQNRALLERDTGLVWIHRTCSLGFHRISAFLAHGGAGFQPQSRQDSAHQTFRMGHRHRPLSNRRHVLPGKQDLIHRRNSPLCLDIDSTKKKFFTRSISTMLLFLDDEENTVPRFSLSGSERSGHGAGTSEYHVRSYHHVRGERLQGTVANFESKKHAWTCSIFSHRFIYLLFFFIYVFVSRDSRLPFEIRLSTLLSFPCETNTDIEYTYFDFNGSCRHEKDSAKRELIVIELHERSSCRVENRRRDGSRRWDVILYNSIAEIGHENHHRKFFTAIGVTCSVRGKYPTKYVVMLWINFFHSGRREGKKTRARIFSYNFSYNFQAGKINRAVLSLFSCKQSGHVHRIRVTLFVQILSRIRF